MMVVEVDTWREWSVLVLLLELVRKEIGEQCPDGMGTNSPGETFCRRRKKIIDEEYALPILTVNAGA